jgi:OOP family OmpA-OmpF porin
MARSRYQQVNAASTLSLKVGVSTNGVGTFAAPSAVHANFRISRAIHMDMKRKLMAFVAQLLGATTLLVPVVASAQVVVVPPPVYHYERLPPPRRGMVWHAGYWRWAHGAYVWAPGVWAPVVVEPGPYRVVVVPPPPAPPPPPPRVERLSADALFPFDKGSVNDIRPQGIADIASIAARLRANPFWHVEVRGYTDRLGTDAYNFNLSQRRAEAVKAELIAQGLPAETIRAEGLGSQDPIVQCSNGSRSSVIACLQPNRRVEIVTYVSDQPRW